MTDFLIQTNENVDQIWMKLKYVVVGMILGVTNINKYAEFYFHLISLIFFSSTLIFVKSHDNQIFTLNYVFSYLGI